MILYTFTKEIHVGLVKHFGCHVALFIPFINWWWGMFNRLKNLFIHIRFFSFSDSRSMNFGSELLEIFKGVCQFLFHQHSRWAYWFTFSSSSLRSRNFGRRKWKIEYFGFPTYIHKSSEACANFWSINLLLCRLKL